jgi:hypothetical protein
MLSFLRRPWHPPGMRSALVSESALDGSLRALPEDTLEGRRVNLRRSNEACGVENNDAAGYHEAPTRFRVERLTTTMNAGAAGG